MKERFNRSLKEAVEAKTLLDQQQGAKVSEVEDKAKEAQNPVYADATRSLKRNQKVKADTIKVEAEPKHDEKPKKPKMVPGAKKMKLDESLFEFFEDDFDDEYECLKHYTIDVYSDGLVYIGEDDGTEGCEYKGSTNEEIVNAFKIYMEDHPLNEALYNAQEVFTDEENKIFSKSELGMIDKDKLSDEDRRMIARRKLGLDKKKVWIDPKDNWTEEERRDYARQELGLKKKDSLNEAVSNVDNLPDFEKYCIVAISPDEGRDWDYHDWNNLIDADTKAEAIEKFNKDLQYCEVGGSTELHGIDYENWYDADEEDEVYPIVAVTRVSEYEYEIDYHNSYGHNCKFDFVDGKLIVL